MGNVADDVATAGQGRRGRMRGWEGRARGHEEEKGRGRKKTRSLVRARDGPWFNAVLLHCMVNHKIFYSHKKIPVSLNSDKIPVECFVFQRFCVFHIHYKFPVERTTLFVDQCYLKIMQTFIFLQRRYINNEHCADIL